MSLGAPRWWYRQDAEEARLLRWLLQAPAALYALAGRRRLRSARPYHPGVPVICVGNLTVGGAGKTPVARALLRRLRASGLEAQGLSRGYGGGLKGPVRVDPSRHQASDVGDEPLMLAADAPIWISRDRAAGARAAVESGAGALVMDDGHQNPSLIKALSLVVVDAETRDYEWPFGDGRVVPAGPCREPVAAGLARADAVILMLPADVPAADPRLIKALAGPPILIAHLRAAAPPPPGPQLGFAGVGKPWKVERALKAAGCQLLDFAPFPDHHPYSEANMSFLHKRAEALGAALLTTEKDWTRLPAPWRRRVAAWPVTAEFEDEDALDALLRRALPQL